MRAEASQPSRPVSVAPNEPTKSSALGMRLSSLGTSWKRAWLQAPDASKASQSNGRQKALISAPYRFVGLEGSEVPASPTKISSLSRSSSNADKAMLKVLEGW